MSTIFPSPQTQTALQNVAGSRAALAQAVANRDGAQATLTQAQQSHDAAVKSAEAAQQKHQQDCEALHASIAADTGVPALPTAPPPAK